MSQHFGFSSPSGAIAHIEALQKKGYIRRDHASRGIKLVAEPPLEISAARVFGHFDENGLVQENKKLKFIPLPDEKDDLIAVVSETNIPAVNVLKNDYVIFEMNTAKDGLAIVSTKNGIFVGFLGKSKFKKLSGEKQKEFKVLGSFYGILRIQERRK